MKGCQIDLGLNYGILAYISTDLHKSFCCSNLTIERAMDFFNEQIKKPKIVLYFCNVVILRMYYTKKASHLD